MAKYGVGLVLFALLLCCASGVSAASPKREPSERVKAILADLTLEQKIGQLNQLATNTVARNVYSHELDAEKALAFAQNNYIGSFLSPPTAVVGPPINKTDMVKFIYDLQTIFVNNGAQLPLLLGSDAVHGHHYIRGATIFPHQINLGAALNPALSMKMAEITAKDTRAVGFTWNFSPILDIAQHPGWPRMFESFGEDPHIATVLGDALIKGYQGFPAELSSELRVAATMKHFIGYGAPRNGQDRTTSHIPDRQLRQYHVPSFQNAVDIGVATVMECYNDVNGEPVVASKKYLKDLLRDEMGYEGMMVTDYGEINDLVTGHHTAEDTKDAARIVLDQTSVDMSMVALDLRFYTDVVELVREGTIPESRIDESALRILQLKEDLGLLDNPLPDLNSPLLDTIGSREDRDQALELARESIILLENNNNALPLDLNVQKNIFLVGPSSDSLTNLCGGWTIGWQGSPSDEFFDFGYTVLTGLQLVAAQFSGVTITHQTGFNINGGYTEQDLASAINATQSNDVTIVALGEDHYAEGFGDLEDLALPAGQLTFLKALIATGRPVVVILIGGRPRLLHGAVDGAGAVINALVPGLEGGQAIAEVLIGQVNPSGKQPVTYPKNHNQVPMQYYFTPTSAADFQWPFGHGLSYTTFSYSELSLSSETITAPAGTITASVRVTNTGSVAGKESVLWFIKDDVREVTPEEKLLFHFEKVLLAAGESVVVTATVEIETLAFYGIDETQKVIQAGTHQIFVGPLAASFRLIV